MYKKHGTSWSFIAKHFSGRTGDMIKNRFYSSLRKSFNFGNNRIPRYNDNFSELAVNNSENGINDSDFNESSIGNNNSKDYDSYQNAQKQKDVSEKIIINVKNNCNFTENTNKKIENSTTVVANNLIRNEKPQTTSNLNNTYLNKFLKYLIAKNHNNQPTNTYSAAHLPTIEKNKFLQIESSARYTYTNQSVNNLDKVYMDSKQKNEKKHDNLTSFPNTNNKKLESCNDYENSSHFNNYKNKNKHDNDYNNKENSNLRNGKNSYSYSDFDIDISSLNDDLMKTDEKLTKISSNENDKLNEKQIISNNVFFMNLNNINKQTPTFIQNPKLNGSSNENNKCNKNGDIHLPNQNQRIFNLLSSEPTNNNDNLNNQNLLEEANLDNLLFLANNLKYSSENQLNNRQIKFFNANINIENFNKRNSHFNNFNTSNSHNNFNFIDVQINSLINCLLETNYSRISYCKDELENQLNILKKLFDLTNMKLDSIRNFTQINSANSLCSNIPKFYLSDFINNGLNKENPGNNKRIDQEQNINERK